AAVVKVRGQTDFGNALRTSRIDIDASRPPKSRPETSKKSTVLIGPPPPPAPSPATTKSSPDANDSDTQAIDNILRKYFDASGGEDALRKLSSRISRGSVEVPLMGLKGTVEIYEAAPDKKSTIINIPGYGIIQRTWDGTEGWIQDPMQGF